MQHRWLFSIWLIGFSLRDRKSYTDNFHPKISALPTTWRFGGFRWYRGVSLRKPLLWVASMGKCCSDAFNWQGGKLNLDPCRSSYGFFAYAFFCFQSDGRGFGKHLLCLWSWRSRRLIAVEAFALSWSSLIWFMVGNCFCRVLENPTAERSSLFVTV